MAAEDVVSGNVTMGAEGQNKENELVGEMIDDGSLEVSTLSQAGKVIGELYQYRRNHLLP